MSNETENPRLAAPLYYARLGYKVVANHHPIFRKGRRVRCSCYKAADCPSIGKHPRYDEDLLPSGVADASSDPDVIRAWWRKWPDANVGIALDDTLCVIDVDPRNGGLASAAKLNLPRTAEDRSGRGDGGGHKFYRPPQGIKLRNGEIKPGVDFLTAGKQVIVWPSIHYSTGLPYEWLPRQNLESCLPADLPAEIAEKMLFTADKKTSEPASAIRSARVNLAAGVVTDESRALARLLAEAVPGAIEELDGELRIGSHGARQVRQGDSAPWFRDYETGARGGVQDAIDAYGIDVRRVPLILQRYLKRDALPRVQQAADLDLYEAWDAGLTLKQLGGGNHPALKPFIAQGLDPARFDDEFRVCRAQRKGVLTPVALFQVCDLAGRRTGIVGQFASEDGAPLGELTTAGEWGCIKLAEADDADDDSAIVTIGLKAGVAAMLARPGRRVLVVAERAGLRRFVLSERVRNITVLGEDDDRVAAWNLVKRHRHRLDSAAFARTKDGRKVSDALDGAKQVWLQEYLRAHALPGSPDASPKAAATAEERRQIVAEADAKIEAELRAFFMEFKRRQEAGEDGKALRLVLKAAAGLGKTECALRLILEMKIKVVYAVPDYEAAYNLLKRIIALQKKLGLKGAALGTIFHGKLRDVTETEKQCLKSSEVEEARKAGISVSEAKSMCAVRWQDKRGVWHESKCDLSDRCNYLRQQPAQITIVVHASLSSKGHPNLPEDVLLVIDERLQHIATLSIPDQDFYVPKVIKGEWARALFPRRDLLSRELIRELAGEEYRCDRLGWIAKRRGLKLGSEEENVEAFLAKVENTADRLSVPDGDLPLPSDSAEDRRKWLDRQRSSDRRPAIAKLFRAIVDWYRHGDSETFGARWVPAGRGDGRVEWDFSMPLAERWQSAAILQLDASDRELLRHPEMRKAKTVVVDAPRNARFVQLYTHELHKGGFEGDKGYERIDVINDFLDTMAAEGVVGFVCAQKDVEGKLRVPKEWTSAHFGALRGDDTHKHASVAVIIGRSMPTSDGVDRVVRALYPDLALPDQDVLPQLGKKLAARNGDIAPVVTRDGVSAIHNEVLKWIVEDELVQAIDRARLVRRDEEATILLLCNRPLEGVQPDELISWNDDVAETNVFAAYYRHAALNGGVVGLSDERMVERRKSCGARFFCSANAAKMARNKWVKAAHWKALFEVARKPRDPQNWCQTPLRITYACDTRFAELHIGVTYRYRAAKQNAHKAIVTLRLAGDQTPEAAVADMTTARLAGRLEAAFGVAVHDVELVGVAYAGREELSKRAAEERPRITRQEAERRDMEEKELRRSREAAAAEEAELRAHFGTKDDEAPPVISNEPVWATLERVFVGGGPEVEPAAIDIAEVDWITSSQVGWLAKEDRYYRDWAALSDDQRTDEEAFLSSVHAEVHAHEAAKLDEYLRKVANDGVFHEKEYGTS